MSRPASPPLPRCAPPSLLSPPLSHACPSICLRSLRHSPPLCLLLRTTSSALRDSHDDADEFLDRSFERSNPRVFLLLFSEPARDTLASSRRPGPHPTDFHRLSLTFHCPFSAFSLPFHRLYLTFHCPSTAFSLPFIDLPLPFHCLSSGWQVVKATGSWVPFFLSSAAVEVCTPPPANRCCRCYWRWRLLGKREEIRKEEVQTKRIEVVESTRGPIRVYLNNGHARGPRSFPSCLKHSGRVCAGGLCAVVCELALPPAGPATLGGQGAAAACQLKTAEGVRFLVLRKEFCLCVCVLGGCSERWCYEGAGLQWPGVGLHSQADVPNAKFAYSRYEASRPAVDPPWTPCPILKKTIATCAHKVFAQSACPNPTASNCVQLRGRPLRSSPPTGTATMHTNAARPPQPPSLLAARGVAKEVAANRSSRSSITPAETYTHSASSPSLVPPVHGPLHARSLPEQPPSEGPIAAGAPERGRRRQRRLTLQTMRCDARRWSGSQASSTGS